MSEWVAALAAECRRTSQANTARRLGVSPAVVNQALQGSYKGNLRRVQRLVEGAFMGVTVDCPVVGDLPRDRCIEYQGRPFAATNPMRVQLYCTCPDCPHNEKNRDKP